MLPGIELGSYYPYSRLILIHMKVKISPSSFGLVFRCVYAFALKRMDGGYSRSFNPAQKKKMGAGVFFERQLTKLASDAMAIPQEEFVHSSLNYFMNHSQLSTQERIKRQAISARKGIDWEAGVELNTWHKVETPYFNLEGEEDIYGLIKGYENKGIIDVKFVEDIDEWVEKMPWKRQQVASYRLMRELKKHPQLIEIYERWIHDQDRNAIYEAVDLYGAQEAMEWEDHFYVVENKKPGEMPEDEEGNPQETPPLIKVATVISDPASLGQLYWQYSKLAKVAKPLIEMGNRYLPDVRRNIVKPSTTICKGKDYHISGECPFLKACAYGRHMLQESISETLVEIINWNHLED